MEFVARVSDAVLSKLLDKLLESGVLIDDELENVKSLGNKSDKARKVIDMVRQKGPNSSAILISALCEVDPFLSKELKLM